YEARRYQPVWSGRVLEEQMAREALAILSRAHLQGLNDDDYRVPRIARPARGAEAARFDVALTEAVLRYSRDVRTGRVRPKDIYTDVALPPLRFNAAAGLSQALRRRSLTQYFSDLPPPHPEYDRLQQAYLQYRAIAEKGGWATIPDKGDIKLEGNDSRL